MAMTTSNGVMISTDEHLIAIELGRPRASNLMNYATKLDPVAVLSLPLFSNPRWLLTSLFSIGSCQTDIAGACEAMVAPSVGLLRSERVEWI